jgi:hypothetical protein
MNDGLISSLATAKPSRMFPGEKSQPAPLPSFQPSSMSSMNKGKDDLVSIMQILEDFHHVWKKHLMNNNENQTFKQWLKEHGMLSL